MNILAIDTTTKNASVALQLTNNNEKKIISDSISNEITHSEKLLPLIDKVLNKANVTLDNISLLACINGPGSFTGIRIGLATIKAFAQIKNVKIFAMSSLEAICYKAYIENALINSYKVAYVASLIDAKNDRVYFALYKVIKNLENKIEITPVISMTNQLINNAMQQIIDKSNEIESMSNLTFAGDCIEKFSNVINECTLKIKENNSLDNIYLTNTYPNPEDVINAMDIISDTDKYITDSYLLDACYARLSQAERITDGKE